VLTLEMEGGVLTFLKLGMRHGNSVMLLFNIKG